MKYVPHFTDELTVIGRVESPGRQSNIIYRVVMEIFKYSFRGLADHVFEILSMIKQQPLDSRIRDFLTSMFQYILSEGREEHVLKVLSSA